MQQLPTHLTIQPKCGSVLHYYHFLLGFLLPLVHYRYFCRADLGTCYVRDCGVMNAHIELLAIPGVRILDNDSHAEMRLSDHSDIEYVSINGFDSPKIDYSKEMFLARDKISMLLDMSTQSSIQRLSDGLKILMINRKPSDPFYKNLKNGSKSGSDRRSIPNFNDLVQSLSHWSPSVVSLEGLKLNQQIQLFREHNVIVAQHGAALSNLVFCNPGTKVIEICPRECIDQTINKKGDFFGVLSTRMNADFFRVIQEGSHAQVDAGKVVQIIESIARD